MAKFKTSEEITTPEKINKILQNIDNNIVKRLKLDENGNLVIEGDIYCNDGYFAADSINLGKIKIIAPDSSEDNYILQVDYDNKLAKWVTVPAPPSHASSHEAGGSDPMTILFPVAASAPTPGGTGHVYFDTTEEVLKIWDGSVWRVAMGRARVGGG